MDQVIVERLGMAETVMSPSPGSGAIPWRFHLLCIGLSLCLAMPVLAASFEFLAVESVYVNPPGAADIQRFAIVVASSRRRFNVLPHENQSLLREYFVYQTRVKVDGQIYYRLALGNFKTSRSASVTLQRLQQVYAEAWIYQRSGEELKQLAAYLKGLEPAVSAAPVAPPQPRSESAAELLRQAREEFIDKNYDRVIALTDKVVVTGNLDQVREALELAGIARERQGKFAQALVLYQALLDTRPPAGDMSRIEARIEGIRTMEMAPRKRLEEAKEEPSTQWNFRGFAQQFYQYDQIDRPDEDSETVNKALITDIDLYAQRRTDSDDLVLRLDAGLVNDFLEDSDETRVSRASVEYSRGDYRFIGGRQMNTLTGIYGRFDGLALQDISRSDYRLGLAYGTQVQSSFDSYEPNRPLLAVNLDTNPTTWLEISFYAIQQEIYDLTDRRAIGSEFRMQNENGFAFTTIDYDVFFEELTNVSLISNYRPNDHWSLNFNLGQGYSPVLTTSNAMQGQPVEDFEDLQDLFTDDEIYQLAEDRTSRSQTLYIGANYRIDNNRYIYMDYSWLRLEETVTSGGVEAVPDSEDTQVSIEYSFQGMLFDDDYASIGARLAESDTSETVSVRIRTRFTSDGGIGYDPRLQIDRRTDKDDDREQIIYKPSLKLKYAVTRKLNLEGTFALEYSELDLPELDKQYVYSLYAGYYYLF